MKKVQKMNKIEIKNLKKDYQNFTLKDVNFSIPEGYVTGFIGRNGMGKTTTIKSMLSLIQYQGDILSIHDDEKTKLNNQKIGDYGRFVSRKRLEYGTRQPSNESWI